MSTDSRSAPLLYRPSSGSMRSLDKMDMCGGSSPRAGTPSSSAPPIASAALRPRPEIILRWKRFALLVTLGAVSISAITLTLYIGIPLVTVSPEDAEDKVELFNSYSGVIMGFVESGISVLLGYLFPVFIVYLHNLKWSPQDDLAKKPISKTKKVALLLFFPIVMVAIGNSLSAVQTNQSSDSSSSGRRARQLSMEASVDGTVFLSTARSRVEPMGDVGGQDEWMLGRVAMGSRVETAGPVPEWLSTVVSLSSDALTARIQSETAVDLLVQGGDAFTKYTRASGIHIDMDASLRTRQRTAGITTLDQTTATAQAVFGGAVGAAPNTVVVQYKHSEPLQDVAFDHITLQIPLRLQSPPRIASGASSCISTSSDPLTRLRPIIIAGEYKVNGAVVPRAVFLFGLSMRATTTASSSNTVSYSLQLTLAKVSWTPASELGDANRDILSVRLPSGQRLVKKPTPVDGMLLSTPVTLVQVVQPPAVVDGQLASVTLVQGPSPCVASTAHSVIVDAYSSFVRRNHLVLDDLPKTVYTAALLYLFKDAVVTPQASTLTQAWERHLMQVATSRTEYQIYVSNTRFGAMSTWTACAILFILSALVLVFPNARARLEPPKGGNARAERFIAVQTEEVYPNLIYKKRFRIGKTGEKIKFREFAVEAVTLHHRMEDDEQIDL